MDKNNKNPNTVQKICCNCNSEFLTDIFENAKLCSVCADTDLFAVYESDISEIINDINSNSRTAPVIYD